MGQESVLWLANRLIFDRRQSWGECIVCRLFQDSYWEQNPQDARATGIKLGLTQASWDVQRPCVWHLLCKQTSVNACAMICSVKCIFCCQFHHSARLISVAHFSAPQLPPPGPWCAGPSLAGQLHLLSTSIAGGCDHMTCFHL